MSEEKLYMVKNDEGEYWDFNYADFWRLETAGCYETTIKVQAEIVADEYGGHVITLIEEPEKVVLTKEQAEIVKEAHFKSFPATFIADKSVNEILFMEAYVNGYTVAKEKRYVLPIPGTDHYNNLMHENIQYYAVKGSGGNWRADLIALDTGDAVKNGYTVNQSDIDTAPAWVKSITPIEVYDEQ